MTDIAMIGAALGSIKTAADIARLIKNSGTSLEKAEVKLQFAELISALADAKIDLADVQALLFDKEQKITELVNQLATKKAVIWEKPYYFVKVDDQKDGPFCQKCYDKEQQLIRLQGGGTKPWNCLSCRCANRDLNYKSPRPINYL
ncbi:hypothetical protein RGQ13_15130 [Thalassotalea psychrophila]|uniref:Uncharacterized protein n=1 Tax=Thalassotalea psychrophila TaxID=3065647 RepID=A0ABY9TRS2_9GAMM|nr:hypothetical protein RGQ13_15130 [Colwelliaceae bacterium SQ149]